LIKRADSPEILFVSLSLDRGGTERHLAALMPRLAAKGWRVSMYCITSPGEMASDVAKHGVEVIGPPFAGGGSGRLVSWLGVPFAALKLFWIMLWRRPGIVHFFLPGPYLIGAPLAILTGRPVRIMSRRSLNLYMAKRPLATWFELRLHTWMTAILGNSAKITSELINSEGCPPANVGLIRNGVDVSAFSCNRVSSTVRKEFGLVEDAVVGVLIANFIHYKGHADLVRALASVQAALPAKWFILCAGRDDGAGAGLRELIAQSGLSQNILVLGPRRDVPALLAAADFGLLCSHEEGFSNAIIECMAAGLPMVVTDVGGNREAVRHGVDGFVVPAHSPKALGVAILTLATNAGLRRDMGAAAAERARSQFSIGACIDAYDRLYRGLLEGRTAATLAPVEEA
jgi:glycosyltransferase involved in cell wall biosynthesis